MGRATREARPGGAHVTDGDGANGTLRVLMIDPNASTPPYDRALCAALARAGCDVTLATSRFLYENLPSPRGFTVDEVFFRLVAGPLGGRLRLTERGARARRLFKAGEYPFDWAWLFARLTNARPDVVHVQWAVAPDVDRWIWAGLRRLGIPVAYTAHNLLPHDPRPGDAARYERLYRAADVVIVHGGRVADALAARWRIRRERVIVAPHGPLLVEEPELDRPAARRRLGLPLDAQLVLFAGLIEPYKGLDDLVAAFASVARSHPGARLVIAGKPNMSLTSVRVELARHGIEERTLLDARFLSQPELAAYLCAADVVVLPYRAATSSGLLLAARRFGRPIVASAVGDFAELVVDGVSGLLVPPRDPSAMADAVIRLLDDPDLAARLGAEGKRATLDEGNWDVAAERTLAAYHAARSRRSRKAAPALDAATPG